MMKRTSFFGDSSIRYYSLSWNCSASSALVVVIDLVYCDIEWFALEMNRDHSVFEIASMHCLLESFVDRDGYSISSTGFLPTVVDTMVI